MGKKIPGATGNELEAVRTGSSVESLKQAFLDNLYIAGWKTFGCLFNPSSLTEFHIFLHQWQHIIKVLANILFSCGCQRLAEKALALSSPC